MSLINEALKRAEQAKTGRLAPQAAPPLKLVKPGHITKRWLSWPMVLGGVGIAIVLFATWLAMSWGELWFSKPKQAAAASAALQMPSVSAGPATPKLPAADTAAQASEASPTGPTEAKLTEVLAKTIPAMQEQPPAEAPAQSASSGRPAESDIAPETPVARQEAPPARPKGSAIHAHETAARNFKLSGIMSSPTGTIAIINGCHMRVGETIDGAKITGIRTHSVQLQIDGQTVTLRM